MDKKTDALKLALEALDCIYSPLHVREINKVGAAMSAIREALAEQPAQQQDIDWKDQYEKQKRRAEMWIAKYEADIGPLKKAGPVKAQQQEPVAEVKLKERGGNAGLATVIHEIYDPMREPLRVGDKLYTSPPAGKQLTDKRLKVKIGSQYGGDLTGHWFYLQPADEFAEAALAKHTGIEAHHGIKE